MSEEIVINDSPEAATYRENIKGWVSRHGRFFGNNPESERIARYDGSTHTRCECGNVAKKSWTHCEDCREKRRHDRWLKLPLGKWDGEGLIFSDRLNEYLEEWEIEEKEEEFGPLDLMICDPIKLRLVDEDYWEDELSLEDGYAELPDHVKVAMEKLNEEIKKMKPVSVQPGRFRWVQPTPKDDE